MSTKIPPLPQLVFTGVYNEEVDKKELERIEFMLHQQSDDDMPCTFFLQDTYPMLTIKKIVPLGKMAHKM